MGADGHIIIYDYDKLTALMGREPLTNATTYKHKIFDRTVLTVYYGDNLYLHECFVCGKMDDDDEAHPYIEKYRRDDCEEKFNKAKLTEWEIWT